MDMLKRHSLTPSRDKTWTDGPAVSTCRARNCPTMSTRDTTSMRSSSRCPHQPGGTCTAHHTVYETQRGSGPLEMRISLYDERFGK